MNTKIYLISNINSDPNTVYIGKTIRKARESEHRRAFGKDIDFSYIDEIQSTDKRVWKPLESFWIEQFRQWGFKVINKNTGGGGPQKHTQATKHRIREANLNREVDVYNRIVATAKLNGVYAEISRRQSGENNVSKRTDVKNKISNSVKRLWENEEYRTHHLNKLKSGNPVVECPHCKKTGRYVIMKRWHFDKCKYLLV